MVEFNNMHPHTGLPSPLWCPCGICDRPLQIAGELHDDSWQMRDSTLFTDDAEPVCEECYDELGIGAGDVVFINEFEHAGAA